MAIPRDLHRELDLVAQSLTEAIRMGVRLESRHGANIAKFVAELMDHQLEVTKLREGRFDVGTDLRITLQVVETARSEIQYATKAITGTSSFVARVPIISAQIAKIIAALTTKLRGASGAASRQRRPRPIARTTKDGVTIAKSDYTTPGVSFQYGPGVLHYAGQKIEIGPDQNVAEFLFATDRKRTESNVADPFGFERAKKLTLGAVRVTVPDDDHHEIGRLELPTEYAFVGLTLYREALDPKKNILLSTQSTFSAEKSSSR